MRIIILGASGQIGSEIYHRLKKDHSVTGTSRKYLKDHLTFDPFKDDWTTLGIADVLINAVGQIEATADSTFQHIHGELTKIILKNRNAIGRPRIIQISALGASPTHRVEFLRTKGIADELLLKHPDTTVVRPSIVCTPRTMIVKKLLLLSRIARTLGFLIVPKQFLNTIIQPVMAQDLADVVNSLCTASDNEVINVVGPDRISFDELVTTMASTMKCKIRTIEVPRVATDFLVNLIAPMFPKIINRQQYELLFEDNIGDSSVAEGILNRKPQSTKQFFIYEFTYASN